MRDDSLRCVLTSAVVSAALERLGLPVLGPVGRQAGGVEHVGGSVVARATPGKREMVHCWVEREMRLGGKEEY